MNPTLLAKQKPIHGNKKFTCFITGQKRTYGDWMRSAHQSAQSLIDWRISERVEAKDFDQKHIKSLACTCSRCIKKYEQRKKMV